MSLYYNKTKTIRRVVKLRLRGRIMTWSSCIEISFDMMQNFNLERKNPPLFSCALSYLPLFSEDLYWPIFWKDASEDKNPYSIVRSITKKIKGIKPFIHPEIISHTMSSDYFMREFRWPCHHLVLNYNLQEWIWFIGKAKAKAKQLAYCNFEWKSPSPTTKNI